MSTDGGQTWAEAEFIDPAERYAWRRWKYDWLTPNKPGMYTLMARARDDGGNCQPEKHDPSYGTYVINYPLPIEVFVHDSANALNDSIHTWTRPPEKGLWLTCGIISPKSERFWPGFAGPHFDGIRFCGCAPWPVPGVGWHRHGSLSGLVRRSSDAQPVDRSVEIHGVAAGRREAQDMTRPVDPERLAARFISLEVHEFTHDRLVWGMPRTATRRSPACRSWRNSVSWRRRSRNTRSRTWTSMTANKRPEGNPTDVLATNFGKPEVLFKKFPPNDVFISSKDGP